MLNSPALPRGKRVSWDEIELLTGVAPLTAIILQRCGAPHNHFQAQTCEVGTLGSIVKAVATCLQIDKQELMEEFFK